MKKTVLRNVGIAVSLLTAQVAFAGNFSVFCSYRNDNLQKCAEAIADIVTDKFVVKFPAAKFQIFVHSNVSSFTNGGFAAYAVAGVVPNGSAQFPVKTYSNTRINGADKSFTAVELANEELSIFRAAVTNLMGQCEISPNCDIYSARNGK